MIWWHLMIFAARSARNGDVKSTSAAAKLEHVNMDDNAHGSKRDSVHKQGVQFDNLSLQLHFSMPELLLDSPNGRLRRAVLLATDRDDGARVRLEQSCKV